MSVALSECTEHSSVEIGNATTGKVLAGGCSDRDTGLDGVQKVDPTHIHHANKHDNNSGNAGDGNSAKNCTLTVDTPTRVVHQLNDVNSFDDDLGAPDESVQLFELQCKPRQVSQNNNSTHSDIVKSSSNQNTSNEAVQHADAPDNKNTHELPENCNDTVVTIGACAKDDKGQPNIQPIDKTVKEDIYKMSENGNDSDNCLDERDEVEFIDEHLKQGLDDLHAENYITTDDQRISTTPIEYDVNTTCQNQTETECKPLDPMDSCDSNPDFAAICSFFTLFGDRLQLTLDIHQLLQAITNQDHLDDWLVELHVKLLRKTKRYFLRDQWERALVRFVSEYSYDQGVELERCGYLNTRIAIKLEVLLRLLDVQFEHDQKLKMYIAECDASDIRPNPCGRDVHGNTYREIDDENGNIRVYLQKPLEWQLWETVCIEPSQLSDLISKLEPETVQHNADLACDDEEEKTAKPKPTPKKQKKKKPIVRNYENNDDNPYQLRPRTRQATKAIESYREVSESEEEETVIVKKPRTARQSMLDETNEFGESTYKDVDKPCGRCNRSNDPEHILLCDMCDDGYHTKCCIPAFDDVPNGDWYCPACEHKMLLTTLRSLHNKVTQILERRLVALQNEVVESPEPSTHVSSPASDPDTDAYEEEPDAQLESEEDEESEDEDDTEETDQEDDDDGTVGETDSSVDELVAAFYKKKTKKKIRRPKKRRKRRYSYSSDEDDDDDDDMDEIYDSDESDDLQPKRRRAAQAVVSYKESESDTEVDTEVEAEQVEATPTTDAPTQDPVCSVGADEDTSTL